MVVSLYLEGLTMGQAGPGVPPGTDVRRSDVRGWSAGAVRRHKRWLFSVDRDAVPELGVGYAVTLTLRDTPASAVEWHRLRRAWLRAVERSGAVAVHWVVEWQKRGTPHLHTAIYFDPAVLGDTNGGDLARRLWVDRAGEKYGAQLGAQYALPIRDITGWTQYLSKHAARGVKHYQRQGVPEGWEKSGRLWGHTGDWPTVEPDRVDLVSAPSLPLSVPSVVRSQHAESPRLGGTSAGSSSQYHALRREVRRYEVAQHRQALRTASTALQARQARRGLRFARGMLKCSDRALSSVRGVSIWIPYEISSALVAFVIASRPVLLSVGSGL
jgi:hypothetical protein